MFLNEWDNCENDSNDVKVVTRILTNKVNSNRESRKHFDRKGNLALISCVKPNLYGLPRGSFCSGGRRNYPLFKTRYNYARNLKFAT